jgi:hypothetical protein
MLGRVTGDPRHWRDRAAHMRALALTMKDPEVIILMTDLAADYEKLAERAAAKMAGKSPPRTDRQSTDDDECALILCPLASRGSNQFTATV